VPHGPDEFLTELFKLMEANSNVKLLATSRDTGNIREWFKTQGESIEIRAHEEDVRHYLHGEVKRPRKRGSLQGISQRNPDLIEEVIAKIVENADGMYVLRLNLNWIDIAQALRT